jgi:Fic family protein
MQQLVDWINSPSEVHPVLVAGVAQFQLVHIHPFVDGNGRTSRLLSTLCLYRSGYDFKRLFTISEFYDRDRAAFYSAIQGVRDADMDLTGWLEFFTAGLATQMQETVARGQQVIRIDLLVQKHGLNERQTIAIAYLFEHEYLDIDHLETLCPGVTRRSLQRDLKALVETGALQSHGEARATRYSLVS